MYFASAVSDWLGIASSVVAVAALVLSAYTTRTTLRHERARATEERLWQKRAEVYVDLIEWAAEALPQIHQRALAGEFEQMPRPVPMVISGSLRARAAVFPSQPVLQALDRVCRCLSEYAGRPLEELGTALDVHSTYAEQFFSASLAITATIRQELEQGRLGTNPPPSPSYGLAYA